MAKILIIHYGGIKVAGKYRTFIFYEGLIETFRDNGNDVMEIITNDFLKRPWNGSNELNFGISASKLIGDIKKFGPDLVISFNNSSIENLEREIDCPIAIWDADHFHHFNDIEKLKRNKDRFLFFCSQTSDIPDCQRIFGVRREQCFLMKPATSVRPDFLVEKSHNIVFIGTPFGNDSEKNKLHRHKGRYVELMKDLAADNRDVESITKKYADILDVEQTVLDYGSVANRTSVLSHVAPLGLDLRGGEGWLDIGLDSSMDIFAAYNPEKVYSVEQTARIYNRSKIGLNINHAQAKTGYSWRVMDILGSSAVLVTNYSEDLAADLGDLSENVFYYSPREAYELCDRLLLTRSSITRLSAILEAKRKTYASRNVGLPFPPCRCPRRQTENSLRDDG